MQLLVQQVINGLVVGSTYAVVALGFSLTFSVLGVVNFTHPTVFMIAMFIALIMLSLTGNVFLVLIAAVVAAALISLIVERVVLRPLRSPNILIPFLGTLGAALFLDNLMAGIFGPDPQHFPALLQRQALELSFVTISPAQLANIGLALVVLITVSYYVRFTEWGRATRALAEDAEVTAVFGINTNRVVQATVALSGALAGIAGVAIASLYGSAWVFVGGLFALKSVICMLVSGNKHVEGVMAVGLALGIVEALVTGYVSSSLRDAVAFLILIAVLYLRPAGLFGSYATAG